MEVVIFKKQKQPPLAYQIMYQHMASNQQNLKTKFKASKIQSTYGIQLNILQSQIFIHCFNISYIFIVRQYLIFFYMKSLRTKKTIISKQLIKNMIFQTQTQSTDHEQQLVNTITLNGLTVNLSAVDPKFRDLIEQHINHNKSKGEISRQANYNGQNIISNQIAIKMLMNANRSAQIPYKYFHQFDEQSQNQYQLMPSSKKLQIPIQTRKYDATDFNSLKIFYQKKANLDCVKNHILSLSEEIFITSIAAIKQPCTNLSDSLSKNIQYVKVFFQQCYPSILMPKQQLIQILGPEIYQLKVLKYKYYQHYQNGNEVIISSCHKCMKIIQKEQRKYQCCSNLNEKSLWPTYLTNPDIYHELVHSLSPKKQSIEKQQVINTKQIFHGYNVYWLFQQESQKPLCKRVYCKKCYSIEFEKKKYKSSIYQSANKQKNFSCHFCLGLCKCKRCTMFELMIEKTSEYIHLGGDINLLKQNLIFPQYFKLTIQKQTKVRNCDRKKCQNKQNKLKKKLIQKLLRNGLLQKQSEIQQQKIQQKTPICPLKQQKINLKQRLTQKFKWQTLKTSKKDKINDNYSNEAILKQIERHQEQQQNAKIQELETIKQESQKAQSIQQSLQYSHEQEEQSGFSFDLINDSPPYNNFITKNKDEFQKILQRLENCS